MLLKLLLSVLLVSSAAFAEKARYDNYRVYTINVDSELQLQALRAIDEYPDGVSKLYSTAVLIFKFIFVSDFSIVSTNHQRT
jgi:hypothetical protein